MENNCNYSDEWQPYINDYDKFEYDVKLKDGTIVENCYPNGGKFNSMSDLHDGQCFDEMEVSEIRFSEKPRYGINGEVSKYSQYEYLDNSESATNENMAKKSSFKNSKMFAILAGYSAINLLILWYLSSCSLDIFFFIFSCIACLFYSIENH